MSTIVEAGISYTAWKSSASKLIWNMVDWIISRHCTISSYRLMKLSRSYCLWDLGFKPKLNEPDTSHLFHESHLIELSIRFQVMHLISFDYLVIWLVHFTRHYWQRTLRKSRLMESLHSCPISSVVVIQLGHGSKVLSLWRVHFFHNYICIYIYCATWLLSYYTIIILIVYDISLKLWGITQGL